MVNEDQTGIIANRFIEDNIRLTYDLISYRNREKLPGLLLCLYFEKAFDSVDWKCMHKVLRAYGFGPDIICQWIYKDIKSAVAVIGLLFQWFSIQRVVKMGNQYHRIYLFCAWR